MSLSVLVNRRVTCPPMWLERFASVRKRSLKSCVHVRPDFILNVALGSALFRRIRQPEIVDPIPGNFDPNPTRSHFQKRWVGRVIP